MSSINNESHKENKKEIKEISEPSCLMNKIKSLHILNNVLEYIKEESFKYKLFIHSKEFQKKLNINVSEFSLFKYIDKQETKLYKLLSFIDEVNPNRKNRLRKDYEKLRLKLNIKEDEMERYILYYYRKRLNDDQRRVSISIFSPIFDIFLKEGKDIFDKLFYINIRLDSQIILKSDYISAFEKLNESNVKYSILDIYFTKNEDISYLSELKINFANIKKLYITKYFTDKIFNINMFTNDDLLNNLVYLNLVFYADKVRPKAFENLNNFKSLTKLKLEANFESTFILNLPNLKYLSLYNCNNITFEKNSCLNLKELYIYQCSIINPSNLIQFPELIECSIDTEKIDKIFDFKSFKKLRNLSSNPEFFKLLENPKLLKFDMVKNYSNIFDKTFLEKLLLNDTIEDASLILCDLSDENISGIQIKNKSIKNLRLSIKFYKSFNSIKNFQNLFNNLTTFSAIRYSYAKKGNFEIIENINSKIDDLKVEIKYQDIKIYCGPFTQLKKIDICIKNRVINLKDSFPLFNDKCEVIFGSLTDFSAFFEKVDFEIIKNIYNNLDKMPNLKQFKLYSYLCKKLNKDFYIDFIEKLLSLNLNGICFNYYEHGYYEKVYLDENQLLKIYPQFKTENIDNIKIQKYK